VTVGRTQLIFRLAVIVAKQLQELPYEKRQGNSIARSWINKLTYDIERSTSEACSLLSLLEFVPKTAKELEEEPQIVIQRLEEVRQYCEWLRSSRALVSPSVLDPAVTRVSVVGNVLDLTSPKGTLQKAFIPYQVCYAVPSEISPLTGRNRRRFCRSRQPVILSQLWVKSLNRRYVWHPIRACRLCQIVLVPMGAIEGSYSAHFAKGITGWDHPDLPALRLASAVLNASESYLWKSVRGAGLAYGANVEIDPESGLCGFSVYRVSRCVYNDHCVDETEWRCSGGLRGGWPAYEGSGRWKRECIRTFVILPSAMTDASGRA